MSPAGAPAGTGPRVHRFASLAEVPQEVRDALTEADSLYVSGPWTEALGRSNPALPIAFWAVRDATGWLAGTPVHLFDAAPPSPTYDPWSLHPGLVEEPDAVRALPHALVGTRNGQGNGLLWAPRAAAGGVTAADRAAAVTALAGAIRAGLPDHVVAWTYTPPALARTLAAALPGAAVLLADTTAELVLPAAAGGGPPDFLGSVRASARRRLRADRAAIDGAGGLGTPERDPAAVAGLSEELAPLLGAVMARHGHTPDVPALARYLRACAAPGLHPAVFTVREADGRPVAFSLCVRHGEEMSVRVVGLDHTAVHARDAMDYAHVAVHGPLALAARTGVRRIDLGVGTLDAKLLRGARLRPLATVVSPPPAGGHRPLPGRELARLPLLVEQSRVLAARRPEDWNDLED
ncbi:GNAT family N-acetyltransferase [Streptomyces sp. NPDC035033]|uniref:GNAT family N-acetyltransferase n=1 Tax=Streptomyces sp. NPDC035033 TaxID=3155368 RepID=UPI0033FBA1E2